MAKIQNETAYKAAMARIEELLPLVNKKVSLTGMQYRVPGWTLPVLRLESIKAE